MGLYTKITNEAIQRAALHAGYRYDLAGRYLMDTVADLLTTAPDASASNMAERQAAVRDLAQAWSELRAVAEQLEDEKDAS